MLVASLVAVGGATAFACGSFSGSDGNREVDVGEAGSSDGALVTSDGGTDGGAVVPADSGGCVEDASGAFLSATFEESPARYYIRGKQSPLPTPVAPTVISAGDDAGATCGAHALDIQMNGVAYTLSAPPQDLGFTAHKMTARFDVLFESLSPTAKDETVAAIGFVNTAFNHCYAYLQTLNTGVNDFGIQTHCGKVDSSQSVANAIPNPVGLCWYRVVFVLDITAQVATLAFNDQIPAEVSLKSSDVVVGANTGFAQIGLDQGPTGDSGAKGHIRIDNVRVDVE